FLPVRGLDAMHRHAIRHRHRDDVGEVILALAVVAVEAIEPGHGSRTSSTRRLRARPSSVSLVSTGKRAGTGAARTSEQVRPDCESGQNVAVVRQASMPEAVGEIPDPPAGAVQVCKYCPGEAPAPHIRPSKSRCVANRSTAPSAKMTSPLTSLSQRPWRSCILQRVSVKRPLQP